MPKERAKARAAKAKVNYGVVQCLLRTDARSWLRSRLALSAGSVGARDIGKAIKLVPPTMDKGRRLSVGMNAVLQMRRLRWTN